MKVFLIIPVNVKKMVRKERLLLKVVLEPEKQSLQLIYWLSSRIACNLFNMFRKMLHLEQSISSS